MSTTVIVQDNPATTTIVVDDITTVITSPNVTTTIDTTGTGTGIAGPPGAGVPTKINFAFGDATPALIAIAYTNGTASGSVGTRRCDWRSE